MDVDQDDITYGSHWTCFAINAVVWIFIIWFFATLVRFGPVQGFANYLVQLMFATARLFWYYATALFAVIKLIATAPSLIGRAAQMSAEDMLIAANLPPHSL